MKLAKSNAEKLFITRARLWANVYWSITDAAKGMPGYMLTPETEADKAMKRFDERFGHRLQGEEKLQPATP